MAATGKTKLSPAQKEVVKLMREGWKLNLWAAFRPLRRPTHGTLYFEGRDNIDIQKTTVEILIEKRIIQAATELVGVKTEYQLTESSKSIEL